MQDCAECGWPRYGDTVLSPCIELALMAVFHRPVTPAKVNSALRELIEELVPGGQPAYVEVSPLANASTNDCFIHVPERVKADGGSQMLGWALWELPGIFVEAEAHAVWHQPTGQYLDIAPKNSATARVFFLPDPKLRFEGRQINNLRKPVISDAAITAYLDTFTEEFNFLNRGERADQFGQIALRGGELQEYESIQTRRMQIWMSLTPRLAQIGPYEPCPCGSGKKLKWCHRSWE